MEYLLVGLLIAAIVVIVAVQAVGRHRRLTRKADSGQTTLPRSTWIVFGASAVFFVFAIVVFPLLLRK
ncbi:hypothetical protein [Frondihabitans cladoniiphilus]|uniref:Secreted protein n=1 Tax=Frondihabitans cladoniiphilus TaxID=715785 RepID=A0ABP8W0M4_9MICO